MTEPKRPVSKGDDESRALPPADGPFDQLMSDALEGIADLLEHGKSASDRQAAKCTALREVAVDLFEFFDNALSGHLSPQQVASEARAWQVLGVQRWPIGSRTTQRTLAALNVLADDGGPPEEGRLAEPEPPPENELERAVVAARSDAGRRRRVWEELLNAPVHLGVVDYELEVGDHAEMTFLGSELQGVRHTFAFTSKGRLQRLLDDAGVDLVAVEATGEELTRFWPVDTWLVLNPGTEVSLVLSPAEVKCLPFGPRVALPPVGEVTVHTVPADPAGEERLAAAISSVPEVERIVVARLLVRATGADLPNPVAVVRLRAGADAASVLPVLDERCAAAGIGGWLALAERPDDPLLVAIAAGGRVVYSAGAAPAAPDEGGP